MTAPALMAVFRQQVQRLQIQILTHWQAWQRAADAANASADDAALTPLRHAVHLLKGAALTVSADALAQALHALETHLKPNRQMQAEACWPTVEEALRPWLLPADASPHSLAQLRQALRTGFAAQARLARQAATLHLDIPENGLLGEGSMLAIFLLDAVPQLLRNALTHGGESEAIRVAAAKPARLQVWLRLRIREGRVCVLVADDGRGTPRPAQTEVDLMSGRGWGVAAVRAALAPLPLGCLRFRARAGVGSMVRITCQAQ